MVHENVHKWRDENKKKQVGQCYRFIFVVRQKLVFQGKSKSANSIFVLTALTLRINVLMTKSALSSSSCEVTVTWPYVTVVPGSGQYSSHFSWKTSPHCCYVPVSDTQRKLQRNVDKCKTVTTLNQASNVTGYCSGYSSNHYQNVWIYRVFCFVRRSYISIIQNWEWEA